MAEQRGYSEWLRPELSKSTSPTILNRNWCRVLREDFGWEGYRIHFMVERLRKTTNRVRPTKTVRVVDDADDKKIIECAVAAASECIVTNDNALLRIVEYDGIRL